MKNPVEKIIVGLTILFALSAVPSLAIQWSMPDYPRAAVAIYTAAAIGIAVAGVTLIWRGTNTFRYIFLLGVLVGMFGFVSGELAVGLFGLLNFPFSFGSVTALGHREGIFLNLPLIVPIVVVGSQAGKAMWEA